MIDLRLGDFITVANSLEPGSLDAIITDLPYGTTACSWDVVIPFAPMWDAVKRVLKPRGVFVTTASQPFTSALVMSNLEWFKYEWIWEKTAATGFLNADRLPMKSHENIIVFSSRQNLYNPQMTTGEKRKNGGKTDTVSIYGKVDRCYRDNGGKYFPKSIMRFSNGHHEGSTFHPSQKPLSLYQYLILTYTNPGDRVGDFCSGSGTTAVACVLTGRNFIGCDNNDEYVKIAEKRIHDAQLQMRLPFEAQ